MRRLILICSIIVFSGSFIFAGEADAHIQLRAFLEQENVALNREAIYHVELSWLGDLNSYHIIEAGEPVVTNLILRGSGSANRVLTDAQGQLQSVKRITYYFKPIEMGMAYIDGVTIQYEDLATQQKETLFAQRLGVKIGEPLPEAGEGLGAGDWFLILLGIGFVFALSYFIYRYFQQRSLQPIDEEIQHKTLEEKYLETLKSNIDPANAKAGDNLNALSKLLFNYISEKYLLAGALTFEIIKEKLLDERMDSALIDKLKVFYDRVELSKFAGEQISVNEFHIFYDTMELLLNRLNRPADKRLGEA